MPHTKDKRTLLPTSNNECSFGWRDQLTRNKTLKKKCVSKKCVFLPGYVWSECIDPISWFASQMYTNENVLSGTRKIFQKNVSKVVKSTTLEYLDTKDRTAIVNEIIEQINYQQCFDQYLHAKQIHYINNPGILASISASDLNSIYITLHAQNFVNSKPYIQELKLKRQKQLRQYSCYEYRQLMTSLYTLRFNPEKALQQYIMFSTVSVRELGILMIQIAKMNRTDVHTIHTNAIRENIPVTEFEIIMFCRDLELKYQTHKKKLKAQKLVQKKYSHSMSHSRRFQTPSSSPSSRYTPSPRRFQTPSSSPSPRRYTPSRRFQTFS
jgi:hypothetical protein